MKTQHTPEGWKIIPGIVPAIHGPNGERIATMYHDNPEEDEANALLIAAAPEMLEALEDAVKILGPLVRKMNIRKNFFEINTFENSIKQAIAKAKGGA